MTAGTPIDLDTKYDARQGRIILTGVQALVRLPLDRARADRAAGLRTAGYISGYRGSPLGGYDMQLAAARRRLEAADVLVRPALNEDLAATGIWGSQQVGLYPGARFEGVFGIWYGKAPGVDRTGDAFKHANFAGVSPKGGVLAIAGDDHGAKSSSLAAQSEYSFMDAEMPVLAPASVAEVLSFGVKALDLSRFAGLWVAMTTVAEVMDSTATVDLDPRAYGIRRPEEFVFPPDGLHIRVPDTPLAQEARHREFRLPAALAFVQANDFDRMVFDSPAATWGIVAAGKAYVHVRQALLDMGVTQAVAARLGLRLYKPGLVWPLEPVRAAAFAAGLREVLVIEERRDLVEAQLKQVCYGLRTPPRILGKRDRDDRPLIRSTGELDADQIAAAILAWLPSDLWTAGMRKKADQLAAAAPLDAALHDRKPFFCSGCPHNTSTRVPEGSRALAGIGCHYLVQDMPRRTQTFTQMGGEGVTWLGQAPFTEEGHVFANLGDGTYFHSGVLAIRQAVAADVNITYKLLFNDAVAMTGGQPIDGVLTPARLARQLLAEGVRHVVILSDDPARTERTERLPEGVALRPREEIDAIQIELRGRQGVTAIIYDQTCATELRRRRKRGLAADPGVRPFINPRVCEGCGDCSSASNCVSIEPLETEFGRKRQIDLSSCNVDLSCVNGFCPSFALVRPSGSRRRPELAPPLGEPPEPIIPPLTAEPFNVVIAGVGGQGVSSLAAVLAMAAHIDGGAAKSVDMLGMAQKGGGVFIHLRLARAPDDIAEPRVGRGQADVLLATDVVVAHGPKVAPLLSPSRTSVFLNEALVPTSDFTLDGELDFDISGMRRRLVTRAKDFHCVPAHRLAESFVGDTIFSGMVLLGRLWQSGRLPVSLGAINRAIELNGVAVEVNRRAFAIGRASAVSPEALGLSPAPLLAPASLDEVIARLAEDLRHFQDSLYARRFEAAILRIRAAEQARRAGSEALTLAAARSLHKLMAYKDEYEVARLYSDPAFRRDLDTRFGKGARVSLSLAPPGIAKKDPVTGHPRKRTYGPWMFALMPALAWGKRLRGSWLDPFGHTAERRLERDLRDEFFGVLETLCDAPVGTDFELLLKIARLPQSVRGYGHVRAAAAKKYRTDLSVQTAALNPCSSHAASVPGQSAPAAVS